MRFASSVPPLRPLPPRKSTFTSSATTEQPTAAPRQINESRPAFASAYAIITTWRNNRRRARRRNRAAGVRWDRYDTLVALGVAVATFFVHPIHLVLTHTYWFDEAWVGGPDPPAVEEHAATSSSTPVGFVALLRLVPGTGLQRARIVVLLFSTGTVVMAYAFPRSLQWASTMRARFAGVVAALVAMLAPLSLGRNDLKQYTCDAFCAGSSCSPSPPPSNGRGNASRSGGSRSRRCSCSPSARSRHSCRSPRSRACSDRPRVAGRAAGS